MLSTIDWRLKLLQDVLIDQAQSFAVGASKQDVNRVALQCRKRLAAGPEFYSKLRSDVGPSSHLHGETGTPESLQAESQKPDALDKEFGRDLYIGLVPKSPSAGTHSSYKSESIAVQGPAEIRRISDLSDVNVIENGIFINFSKRHARIPILKGLKEYDEKHREEGGYGDVYRIENPPGIEKAVAVKVMRHPDLARRYRAVYREIYAWSLLVEERESPCDGHPSHNFLPLYGICLGLVINDPCPALVSPWCKDGNLFQYAKGSLPSKKFNLLAQAAQGIKFLHSRSPPIIHGDVKATNILIWEGRAVLADFGIAKCLDGVKGLSPTGRMWYTASYRAPELRLEYEEYPTTESDVYAFGATVLETLAESPPFNSYTEAQINSFLEMDKTPADVEFRPKVGPAMEDCHWEFMQECLNFHQCDRPSISDILNRLKEFQDRSSSHIPS
ncbi:kinase-like protein [Schizopora paradoxa]|uniref:Kinase-like protein n=1 Tax=Schizopora paradoxa TaxID=27342 RepID=A0A0H2S081_9AGAM|nr:kinase-like protein [Schizopora paradoxa]